MYSFKSSKAFTLVELIIVVVILAILATIAFLSFHKYTSSARDSTRLTDISSLNSATELFFVNSSKYPDPSSVYTKVVYSGGIVFEQGKVSNDLLRMLSKVNKKPVDPLDGKEYIYSANLRRTAFQIKGDLENKLSFKKHIFLNNYFSFLSNEFLLAKASDLTRICYVKGNFNGLLEMTNTGNTNYLLAVPGLIVGGDIDPIIDYGSLSGKVVCNGLSMPCIITYNPKEVFIGSGNSLPDSNIDIANIMMYLKESYSGSNVANNSPAIVNLFNSKGSQLISLGANTISKAGMGNGNISSGLFGANGTETIDCNFGVVLTGNRVYFNNFNTYSFLGDIGTPNIVSYNSTPNENSCEWKCDNGFIESGGDCIPNSYLVTFNKQGGTGGSDTVMTDYNSSMAVANAPTRSWYDFLGYFDAISGGNQYYSNTMESTRIFNNISNITLYARWSPQIITTGTNISTVSGQPIYYAGDFAGRTIWVAGTSTSGYKWKTSNTRSSWAYHTDDGRKNTGVNNATHPAGDYCNTLVWGGYSDWYLPAMPYGNATKINCESQPGEMQFLYCKNIGTGNQQLLGYALSSTYWASTQPESAAAIAMCLNFGTSVGVAGGYRNDYLYSARCIRVAN